MDSTSKVALITGGASGMGYAVASGLAAKGDWDVHILDINEERGMEAAKRSRATFHQVDVGEYTSLANAFKTVFTSKRRLDFVFANAGIVGSDDFYQKNESGDEPPPQPPRQVVDINLISVMNTSYLAQHYFRQSPNDGKGPRSLIITASCGGIYAAPAAPTYAAAKFGTVGWTRSIAPRLWREDGIRVNAILPGTVRTNLLPDNIWGMFPESYFTPMEKIAAVVEVLLDGEAIEADGTAARRPIFGQCVEINCQSHHLRKQHDYCDNTIAAVMPTEIN